MWQIQPYIIARALPVEAIIHTRALSLFGSVSRLGESSVEKSVARRQLSIKAYGGNSWLVDIRRLCVKNSLPDLYTVLNCPPSKGQWKNAVHKAVYAYWVDNLKWRASFYSSLEYISVCIRLLARQEAPIDTEYRLCEWCSRAVAAY